MSEALTRFGGAEAIPHLVRMPSGSDAQLSALEGFLLSRVDGRTPVRVIAQLVGLSLDETREKLARFHADGFVRFDATQDANRSAAFSGPARTGSGSWSTSVRTSSSSSASRSAVRSTPAGRGRSGSQPASGASSPVGATQRARRGPEPGRPSGSVPGTGARPVAGGPRTASRPAGASSSQVSSRSVVAPAGRGGRSAQSISTATSSLFAQMEEATGVPLPRDWPLPPRMLQDEFGARHVLDVPYRIAIEYIERNLPRLNAYELLGVSHKARRREIRQAYMRMSAAFHPDRWFRQDLSGYEERIETVFKAISAAFAELNSPARRARLDQQLGEAVDDESSRNTLSLLLVRARAASTAGKHREAVELFRRACTISSDPALRIRLAAELLRVPSGMEAAERLLDRTRQAGRGMPAWHRVQGVIFLRQGNATSAAKAFEAALELNPEDAEARRALRKLRGQQ